MKGYKCKCGCDKTLFPFDKKGRKRYYILGHNRAKSINRIKYKIYKTNKEKRKAYYKEYYANNRDKFLLYSKIRHYKSYYDLTLNEINQIKKNQNNKCAICEKYLIKNNDIHIDHNHNNNKVRSILCRQCNYLIGNAKENINILNKAIDYLKKWEV